MAVHQLIVGDRVHSINLTEKQLASLLGQSVPSNPQPSVNENIPSKSQLGYAKGIATKMNIQLPDDVSKSKQACWQFINDNKHVVGQ